MAAKKAKKPAVKAKATRASTAKPVKPAAAKKVTRSSAAKASKDSAGAGHSSNVQILTVVFALLALIFMAMAFYAYS